MRVTLASFWVWPCVYAASARNRIPVTFVDRVSYARKFTSMCSALMTQGYAHFRRAIPLTDGGIFVKAVVEVAVSAASLYRSHLLDLESVP